MFLSRRRQTPVICLCVETVEFQAHHSSPISVPVAATLPVLSGSAFMRTRSVGIEQIAVFVSTATAKDRYYLFGMTAHTHTHTPCQMSSSDCAVVAMEVTAELLTFCCSSHRPCVEGLWLLQP